jgi:hypothetical protein
VAVDVANGVKKAPPHRPRLKPPAPKAAPRGNVPNAASVVSVVSVVLAASVVSVANAARASRLLAKPA